MHFKSIQEVQRAFTADYAKSVALTLIDVLCVSKYTI